MKQTIIVAAFALLATAAQAHDGVAPLSAGVVPQSGWNPFASVQLTASELDAQRTANTAARRETFDAIIRAGGCKAPILPVEYATYCWSGGNAVLGPRHGANPTGGPVGASEGGSDGGDGGSSE